MVEYALLNGMIELQTIAAGVGNLVEWVNWPVAAAAGAGAMLVLWSMKPKGPYR
jgi:Flp pilus assembly pilin Flp